MNRLSLKYLIPGLLALFSFTAIMLGYWSGEREMSKIVLEEEVMHFQQQMVRTQETLEALLETDSLGVIKLYVAAFGAERQNSLTFLADGKGEVIA